MSEKKLENMILSDKWTTMSDSEIEKFMATPGMCVIETEGHIHASNGGIPEDFKDSPNDELLVDVASPENQNSPGDSTEDPFEFPQRESIDEFIIHYDTINFEDSRYDHVYMSCFADDSFFWIVILS